MGSVRNTTTFNDNTEIKKGTMVSVRLFDGSVVKRVVWDKIEKAVFLCSERCYQWLLEGSDAPTPIGFPLSDIVNIEGHYEIRKEA